MSDELAAEHVETLLAAAEELAEACTIIAKQLRPRRYEQPSPYLGNPVPLASPKAAELLDQAASSTADTRQLLRSALNALVPGSVPEPAEPAQPGVAAAVVQGQRPLEVPVPTQRDEPSADPPVDSPLDSPRPAEPEQPRAAAVEEPPTDATRTTEPVPWLPDLDLPAPQSPDNTPARPPGQGPTLPQRSTLPPGPPSLSSLPDWADVLRPGLPEHSGIEWAPAYGGSTPSSGGSSASVLDREPARPEPEPEPERKPPARAGRGRHALDETGTWRRADLDLTEGRHTAAAPEPRALPDVPEPAPPEDSGPPPEEPPTLATPVPPPAVGDERPFGRAPGLPPDPPARPEQEPPYSPLTPPQDKAGGAGLQAAGDGPVTRPVYGSDLPHPAPPASLPPPELPLRPQFGSAQIGPAGPGPAAGAGQPAPPEPGYLSETREAQPVRLPLSFPSAPTPGGSAVPGGSTVGASLPGGFPAGTGPESPYRSPHQPPSPYQPEPEQYRSPYQPEPYQPYAEQQRPAEQSGYVPAPGGYAPATPLEPPPAAFVRPTEAVPPPDPQRLASTIRQVEAARRHLLAALMALREAVGPNGEVSMLSAVERSLASVAGTVENLRGAFDPQTLDRVLPGEARFSCAPPWQDVPALSAFEVGLAPGTVPGATRILIALGYDAAVGTTVDGQPQMNVAGPGYRARVVLQQLRLNGGGEWQGYLDWHDANGHPLSEVENLGPAELTDDEVARRVDDALRRRLT
jgi:hypothetical protein